MPQDPYAADDYASIAAKLREIEAQKRYDSPTEPGDNPQKWGIWMNIPASLPCWAHVIAAGAWAYTGSNSQNPALRPTLYATRASAQAIIDMEDEEFRKVCEVREYPGDA